MQGWRVDMEDAHTVEPKLVIKGQPFESWSFFAVFDGHAGAIAAKMCSTRLIENILSQEEFQVNSCFCLRERLKLFCREFKKTSTIWKFSKRLSNEHFYQWIEFLWKNYQINRGRHAHHY